MTLSIPSLSENFNIKISEFTLEDFRYISFMIEQNNDIELYNYLVSKIETPCNAFDKFYALFKIRRLLVNDSISFNNGTSNVAINLKAWDDAIIRKYIDIKKVIIYKDFIATVNYPEQLLYENYEDMIMDCVSKISYGDKEVDFLGMDITDKRNILEKIPPTLFIYIKDYILEMCKESFIIMESKFNLPEIDINIFNGNAYELLKILYNYYNYDDIIELVYMLSKKINDAGYLNSRNPRDLDLLIKIYSEDVEKTSHESKSYI